MDLIGSYKNGNYTTKIYDDGTKIRITDEDKFIPHFAESIDCKICNRCDMGCDMCHEDSTPDGGFGDILKEEFIRTLWPYQELAIGGGNPLCHPDLIPFLEILKDLKVIPNITVNQVHFEKNQDLIHKLVDEKLIYGLGISLVSPTDEFINLAKEYPNAVIHVINGIFNMNDFLKLANKDLKLLILGYKKIRRGKYNWEQNKDTITLNQEWLKSIMPSLIQSFYVVSFDNLAIEQLEIKSLLSDEQWEDFYMGDDAEFTFYIDMVERKFARNSTAPDYKRYDLMSSVDSMFKFIKEREIYEN